MKEKETTPLEALEIISTISLSHLECSRDEGRDGEWEYTEYEEDDGTIEENFPQEIHTIKCALNDFEWLKTKLNLTFLDSLADPEDKERLLKIMGISIDY